MKIEQIDFLMKLLLFFWKMFWSIISGGKKWGDTNFCPGAVRPGIVLKAFVQDMSRTNFFLLLNLPQKPKSKQFPLTNKKLEDTSRTSFLQDTPRTDNSRTKNCVAQKMSFCLKKKSFFLEKVFLWTISEKVLFVSKPSILTISRLERF